MGKAPSGSFPERVYASVTRPESAWPSETHGQQCVLTRVADSGVVDLNSDLVCLGRGDLDVLDAQLLACFPCYGRLASNGLVTLASQLFCLPVSKNCSASPSSFAPEFPSPQNPWRGSRSMSGSFRTFPTVDAIVVLVQK